MRQLIKSSVFADRLGESKRFTGKLNRFSSAHRRQVVGGAGLTDGRPQSADEEERRGPAGRPHQQADAAHQGQTAAPQDLHRPVEPAQAGAQQGGWLSVAQHTAQEAAVMEPLGVSEGP